MSEPKIGDLEHFSETHPEPTPSAPVSGALDSPRQPPARRGDGFAPAVLAGFFAATMVLWGYWFFIDRHDGASTTDSKDYPAFVVVDSDTLLQAKLQDALMVGMANPNEIAEEFRESLDEAFEIYTQRGISIAHKNAFMAYPKEYDVTNRIAAALSISDETIASVLEFQRTGKLPQSVIDRVSAGAPVPSRDAPSQPETPDPQPTFDQDVPDLPSFSLPSME